MQVVSGTADGGGHAWNQVKVNGSGILLIVPGIDPVGGGYEIINIIYRRALVRSYCRDGKRSVGGWKI